MSENNDITVIDTLLAKENNDDTALLLRVIDDDVSAFEQIYYRWSKHVNGFMFKITRSVIDSEDITQETFARLWNMRKNIDPERSVQVLIFTIARRIAVDMHRRRNRMEVSSNDDSIILAITPHEILEELETNLLLSLAIEGMPLRQREVFRLYYFQNMSPKEIAYKLGLSYDNVRKHIYNGKRRLQEILLLLIIFLSD